MQKYQTKSKNIENHIIHEEEFDLFSIIQAIKKRHKYPFHLGSIILLSQQPNEQQIQQVFSLLLNKISESNDKSLVIEYIHNYEKILLDFLKILSQSKQLKSIHLPNTDKSVIVTSNMKKIKLLNSLNSINIKQLAKNKCLQIENLQLLAEYLKQFDNNAEQTLKLFFKYVVLQECDENRKIIKYSTKQQAIIKINSFKPLIWQQTDILFQIQSTNQSILQNQMKTYNNMLYPITVSNLQKHHIYIGDMSLFDKKIEIAIQFYTDLLKYTIKSLSLPLLILKMKNYLILASIPKYLLNLGIKTRQKQNINKIGQYIKGKIVNKSYCQKGTKLNRSKIQNYILAFKNYKHTINSLKRKNIVLLNTYLTTLNTFTLFQHKKKFLLCQKIQSNIRQYLSRKKWLQNQMEEYLTRNQKQQQQYNIRYSALKQLINNKLRRLQLRVNSTKITSSALCSQLQIMHISSSGNIQILSPEKLQQFFMKVITKIERYYEKTSKLLKIVKIEIIRCSIRLILDNGAYFQYGIIQNQVNFLSKSKHTYKKNEPENKENMSPNITVKQKIIQATQGDYRFLIDSYGRVFAQGDNQYHQLGLKNVSYSKKFTKLPIQGKVKQLLIGFRNVTCLTQQSKVFLWGYGFNQHNKSPLSVPLQLKNTIKMHEKQSKIRKIAINNETILAQLQNGDIKNLLTQQKIKPFVYTTCFEQQKIQLEQKSQGNISNSQLISTKYASTRSKQSTLRSLNNSRSQNKNNSKSKIVELPALIDRLQTKSKTKEGGMSVNSCLKTVGNNCLEITYYIRYYIKTYDKIKQKQIKEWIQSENYINTEDDQKIQELLLD